MMRNPFLHLLFALFLLASPLVYGSEISLGASAWQPIPNGKARFLSFTHSPVETQPLVTHALELELAPEWHSYWRNPGDSGAAPIIFVEKNKEEIPVKIHYPVPMRIEIPPLSTYGYEGRVLKFLEVPQQEGTLVADILVCKIECIPGFVEAEITNFPTLTEAVLDTQKLVTQKAEAVPSVNFSKKASYFSGATQTTWSLGTSANNNKILDLFWLPEQVNSLKRPFFVDDGGETLFYSKDRFGAEEGNKEGLLLVETPEGKEGQWVTFTQEAPRIWLFFLMAFMGGLILNVMPCVFPIISLKAFAIAQSTGKSVGAIRKENLAYSLGVVLSFWLMAAVLVLIRESGQSIGWGFQMQNPWFVGTLLVLFVVLALSFFDLWSWNWVPGFASKNTGQGTTGSFFSGLLAVVVASPCTAPFMGAALGFALGQSLSVILIIFTGLGLGMALPFILFSIVPKFSKILPRPGAWMLTFKKAMGIMLLLTAIWLGWIQYSLLSTPAPSSVSWRPLVMDNWDKMLSVKEPRFINFTAEWCVTCQVNERVVFQREEMQSFFKANGIELYKVDWTQREEVIAQKLTSFGRAGVPLYLYFPANSVTPILLPEILSLDLLQEKIVEANSQP